MPEKWSTLAKCDTCGKEAKMEYEVLEFDRVTEDTEYYTVTRFCSMKCLREWVLNP